MGQFSEAGFFHGGTKIASRILKKKNIPSYLLTVVIINIFYIFFSLILGTKFSSGAHVTYPIFHKPI